VFALAQWAYVLIQMAPMPFQLDNVFSFQLAHVSSQLPLVLVQWAPMPIQVAPMPF
jgi:hypothetical protein